MRCGKGKAHRVGLRAFNLYVPADVAADSTFPWRERQSGRETQVAVVCPGEAVLVARAETELGEAELAALEEAVGDVLAQTTDATQQS